MKLNNRGWGYRKFVFFMCCLIMFLFIANHYIDLLMTIVKGKI